MGSWVLEGLAAAAALQDLLLEVERIQDGPNYAFARLGVDVELFAARAQRSIAAKVGLCCKHRFCLVYLQCLSFLSQCQDMQQRPAKLHHYNCQRESPCSQASRLKVGASRMIWSSGD